MQQERDKVAVAFVASQQVAQTSAQVAEIRQQLALLQAEIYRACSLLNPLRHFTPNTLGKSELA
jgi:uncharacterized small protein (DUF1192 family)